MKHTHRVKRRQFAALAWLALGAGRVGAVNAAQAAQAAEAAASANTADAHIDAPNVVPISARLVTAGQPTARALARLGAQGFGAVIDLAPPDAPDAVAGEAEIVRGQGLEFVAMPIDFRHPGAADFDAFASVMQRLSQRKVLVHCQVNMRASSLTFLYRVMHLHVAPDVAYEAVARVWSPRGPWKALIVNELKKAQITFEPF